MCLRGERGCQVASEGRFNLGVGCELATLGLGKTFEHGREVRGLDRLRIGIGLRQKQHGARDLILAIGGQLSDRFQGLFQ